MFFNNSNKICIPSLILGISLLLTGVSIINTPKISANMVPISFDQNDELANGNNLGIGISSKKANPSIINPLSLPVRVVIPKLSIDLPVQASPVVSGFWTVYPNTASYGIGSGTPGQNGNVVIFAHAKYGQFDKLKSISVGSRIYINTSEKSFVYVVTNISRVSPNNTDSIQDSNEKILTLYTCEGENDRQRLVVRAHISEI